MNELVQFEDHGNETYTARFADGSEYGVRPSSDDPSPMHRQLVEALKSGTAKIVAHVRDTDEIKSYLENRIDQIATHKLNSPFFAVDVVRKAKLDEARDVLDMVLSDSETAIAALSPEELQLRYPMLSVSGLDIVATARLVQAKALEQRQELSKIEAWRLEAKRQVRGAPNADLAELAFKAVTQ